MHPHLPTTFLYQRSNTLSSWLWWLWLRFPVQLRARVYQLLWKYTGHFESPSVRRLPLGIFAKLSDSQEEVLATEFVRLNTTIPVPKVLDIVPYHRYWGKSVMFLTKCIPGVSLPDKRVQFSLNKATPEQMEVFQRTLYDWLSQLRSFSTPYSEMVCGFSGGALRSYRIDSSLPGRIGPFSDVKVFHAQNFCTAYPDYPSEADEKTKRLILERPSKQYRICLTHGDLQPHNILIDDKNRPCGLIDWETASWMPEYWEHTSAVWIHLYRYPGWANMWRNMFPQYEDDLCIDTRVMEWYSPV